MLGKINIVIGGYSKAASAQEIKQSFRSLFFIELKLIKKKISPPVNGIKYQVPGMFWPLTINGTNIAPIVAEKTLKPNWRIVIKASRQIIIPEISANKE